MHKDSGPETGSRKAERGPLNLDTSSACERQWPATCYSQEKRFTGNSIRDFGPSLCKAAYGGGSASILLKNKKLLVGW